jgi:phytoene desaturase
MSKPQAIVIGAGFAGLSAASYLAQGGFEVCLIEKNEQPGGRCRQFKKDGFTFDMGPSWYWMPEVFEKFFADFGKKVSDFYKLERLTPSYRVYFKDKSFQDIPSDYDELKALFESWEKGAGPKLDKFLAEAAYKYEVGMDDLVHKPSLKWSEFLSWKVISGSFKLDITRSFSKHIRKYFSHPKILELLEFPVLFLGATPENTPALYSLMNYADIKLGTWYPLGGMHEISKAMEQVAIEQGVKFLYGQSVEKILSGVKKVKEVKLSSGECLKADLVVSGADYHHTDKKLLKPTVSNYTDTYWDNRVLAPSSLLFYVGLDTKIPNLKHHTLFFDEDFKQHAEEIYETPQWPKKPLFYMCAPSVTDPSVAPEGCENLFLLIPVAADLKDNEEIKERYFNLLVDRIRNHTGINISDHIKVKESYAYSNFVSDYNSFKGNAYGLANTLKQTAVWKPKIKNKNMKNMFYTGQLTTPGPGVPPSIISGKVVANYIIKNYTHAK